MHRLYLAALLLATQLSAVPTIDEAFDRIYSFDFAGARRIAAEYVAL